MVVYFNNTISSFSTKMSYQTVFLKYLKKFTKIGNKNNKTFISKEINETIKQLSK